MKTMMKNDQIVRSKESEENQYLKMGYSYIPKSVWKKEVRDINKSTDNKEDKKVNKPKKTEKS